MEITASDKMYYSKFFSHFALRLSERYNLLISFEDYVYLSKLQYIQKAEFRVTCKVGFLNIKGIQVRVMKSTKRLKPLLTALPINN